MQQLILSPIPIEDLIEKIREVVKAEIKAEHSKELADKMLSPSEAMKCFEPSISKVTLAKWTTDGHLTRYDIGGRVYYKQGEILEAAKNLHKYKRK